LRIKIITLYSGEKEYEESKESVKRQKVSHSVDVSFIENKTKPEAHGLLYKTIMSEAHKYDYFIKFDADMIFTDDGAIEKIIQYAVESGADIFSIPVHDFMTDSMIWGLNVYRSGVRWFVDSESLFTDQQRLDGSFSSAKRYLKKSESLVSHASMADDFQGFVFGIHRAAKIVQKSEKNIKLGHSYIQLKTMKLVLSAWKKDGNRVRGWALVGAYLLAGNKLGRYDMNSKSDYLNSFHSTDFENKIIEADKFFSKKTMFLMVEALGVVRFFKGIGFYLKRKIWS